MVLPAGWPTLGQQDRDRSGRNVAECHYRSFNGQRRLLPKEPVIQATPNSPVGQQRGWRQLNWIHIVWGIFIHAGLLLAPFTFSWSGLVVCIILYMIAGHGLTLGYHRLLTHRSFQTPKWMEYLLTAIGSLANQGGPLQWVAVHRVHHQYTDAEGDPHSPRDGWWWSHVLWWLPHVPSLDEPAQYERYIVDLAKDPVHRFFQRWHILLPISLAVVVYFAGEAWGGLGLSWLIWGMFVRTALLYHATWFVNSATHGWGYRNFTTSDDSTNLWWVGLIGLGEGWHNNHHAFPRSARHGMRWWEFDSTFLLIRLLSLVGLARQIHVPGRVLRPVKVTVRKQEPVEVVT
jgi:stearoyl-CoA desaturase (delta-9 desaturase)